MSAHNASRVVPLRKRTPWPMPKAPRALFLESRYDRVMRALNTSRAALLLLGGIDLSLAVFLVTRVIWRNA